MTWNYKEQGSPKLTPEFRDAFMMNIKGKEAVLAAGLQSLAHEKGIKTLKNKLIQFPSKDNDNTAIVESTLIGYDWCPATNQIIEVEYVAIGDANPKNCTAMVAAAFIRMAETRSVSRVCKNYVNVATVSVEELSNAVEDQVVMISNQQINNIASLTKRKGIAKNDLIEIMAKLCNKQGLRQFTESEGKELTKILEEYEEVVE